jgi:Dolichyl-phosphate-mannose-protein mannosyltransferase
MTHPTQSSKGTRRSGTPSPQSLILLVILSAAAFIRFHGIDTNSLWTDEFYSLEFSCGHGGTSDTLPRNAIFTNVIAPTHLEYARSIPHIFSAMELDTHPPLYPIVLRFWREVFGEDAVAGRSLSVIFSIVAVVMLFLSVRELNGSAAGLWSAALLAVAAAQVQFAQLIRSYAMLMALVLACCWIIARIEKRGGTRGHFIAFGILCFCAMLTHYYAAPPLAAIALYALIRFPNRDRKWLVVTGLISAAAWCIVWGPFFWRQIPNFTTNMTWILEDPNGHVSRSLARAAQMPVNFLIPPRPSDHVVTFVGAILYFIPLLVIRKKPGVLLWWLILIFSVGLVLATDLKRSSEMLTELRYTTLASAATCALVILLIHHPRGGWWHVLPAAIVVAVLCSIAPAYDNMRPDYRGMGNYISAGLTKNDSLVIIPPPNDDWIADNYYLSSTHYLEVLPSRAVVLTQPASPEILAELKKSDSIWIIRGDTDPPDTKLPGSKLIESQSFPFFAIVQHVTLKD